MRTLSVASVDSGNARRGARRRRARRPCGGPRRRRSARGPGRCARSARRRRRARRCSTARASSDATRSGVSPRGRRDRRASCPRRAGGSRRRSRAMPRSSPMATRCDGGGSTSLTSSVRASPNVRPHWPQMADASASSARSASTAPASVPPMAGAPPGRHAHDEGAQRRPQAADGADGRRARPEDADHLRLAPAVAQDDRAPDLGLDRAIGARAGGCGRRRR